tara:strand:+ start:262 stop:372 length:111 start_codon:yes stop_codon:yes gene_type:complete
MEEEREKFTLVRAYIDEMLVCWFVGLLMFRDMAISL